MSKEVEKFDRKVLFDYLLEMYSITKLPKHFYMKMSNIFNGKLDGLSKPIPPEHMYDMWVQKSNFLNRIYNNNISKGKKMDSYPRLNYDLAIILSKYDDYLGWLDKQKANTAENKRVQESVSVTNIVKNYNVNHNNTDSDESISDILDELI